MTKELVLEALAQAYRCQQPQGEVLHHSDRGSQYALHEYQERLKKYGMKGSMSRGKEAYFRVHCMFLQWKANPLFHRVCHAQPVRTYVPKNSVILSIHCVQSIDKGSSNFKK
ncbi:hypothetical protein NHB30_28235 [Aneurinibacillus migulanus]|nr:DDE-type integrase/transposase/recombinase [Aneurinibacillus migulanus]MCP1359341.1 hypothetical protein [Aneurinibacillus migulanus]